MTIKSGDWLVQMVMVIILKGFWLVYMVIVILDEVM